MGKSTPTPPPQPDPKQVAAAQTGSNVTTAVANSTLQNANQYGPYGSTEFKVAGNQAIYDPSTKQTYNVPQYSQTTTLSPAQQHLLDQQQGLSSNLNDLAGSQLSRVGDTLGRPIQAPSGSLQRNLQMGNAPTTFGNAGPIQSQFGQTQQGIQGQVSPTSQAVKYDVGPQDWSADRKKVEDALYARLNPQLDRDRAALENNLANQGFTRGGTAFNQSMDEANRQANDARLGVIREGGAEQTRLANLDFQQGQFFNNAQAQNYGQNLSSGQFANAAQAQDFGQQEARGQFANQAQSQYYDQLLGRGQFAQSGTQMNNAARQAEANFGNQAYAQQLQTDLAMRNQIINETSALMNGGQVQLPQFQGYQGGTVGQTPIGDYYMQNAAMQNANYQTQANNVAQQNAGLYGGIGSVAGAGLYGIGGGKISDRRMKRDIQRIGEWLNGLPIYLYRYLWSNFFEVGFMAQDVEKVMPAAVGEYKGIKYVNYAMAMGAR